MKKKILSIILSVVTIVSALSVGSMTAFAGGWVSSAYNVNLNTTYSESVDSTDVYVGGCYYDAVKFTIPAKGKINIKLTSEDIADVRLMWSSDCMYIYKTSNTESYLWSGDSNCTSNGYNAGLGYYYGNYSATLSKGTYYLVLGFNRYDHENQSYDFKLSYTPSFSRTSIRKTSTPKKGQIRVDWEKCSNVSGYQVQYSRNKDMKNAKRITAKGSNNYSRTIKNLKGKKKYYVRVRTYKVVKVNGKNKTYYSKWSSKKAVTTR